MSWEVVGTSALLATAACAAWPAPERAWIEVRSANVRVLSDAREDDARAVARRLEQVRAAFATFRPGMRLDPGLPLVVMAARDRATLRSLVPSFFTAGRPELGALNVSSETRLFVVLRADDETAPGTGHSPAFHEYIHLLQSLNYRTLPLWLTEGLAEFYANAVVENGRLHVGRATTSHIASLRDRKGGFLPVAELFATGQDSPYYDEAERASIFYAQAWALTHWLILGDGGANASRLRLYLVHLEAGMPPAQAAAALGDPEELRRVLISYVPQSAGLDLGPVAGAGAEAAVARAEVPAGEVAAWRALVQIETGVTEETGHVVEEALRLAPESPVAHEALATLRLREHRLPEARAAASRVLALDPDNVPARILSGRLAVMPGGEGVPAAIRHLEAAAALAPRHGIVPSLLADVRAAAGAPPEESLELARRGVELSPSVLVNRFVLAKYLLRAGQREAARAEAQSALALADREGVRAVGRTVLAEIEAAPDPRLTASDCGKNPTPCTELALQHVAGRGVARDPAKARLLLGAACAAGDGRACHLLADLVKYGVGGPAEPRRAAALAAKACDSGYEPACARR